MSESTRQRLAQEIAQVLLGLESLSDGKTTSLNSKVHGGEDDNELRLLRDKSPYDFFVSAFESLCSQAKARLQSERRQNRQPMTKLEEDYWFFEEWEGKDYRTVADRTGSEPGEVWRKRERRGVNPQNGRPLDKAA